MREDLLKNLGIKFIKGKVFGMQLIALIALSIIFYFTNSRLNYLREQHAEYRNERENIDIWLMRNGLNETLLALSDKSTFTSTVYLTAFWSADVPKFQKALANSEHINNNISLKREAQKINTRLNAIAALFRDDKNQLVVNETNLTENTGIILSEIEETLPILETFSANLNRYRQEKEDEFTSRIAQTKYVLAAAIAGFLVLMLLLTTKLYQQYTAFLKTSKNVATELRNGNIPEPLKTKNDESGAIIEEFNGFFQMLHTVQLFAKEVGEGKFDSDISVFDNKGDLGNSLNEMKESLKRVAAEDEQRNWVNAGFAKFGDILRSSHDDIEQLSDNLLSNLVGYLNANQGAIYLINDESNDRNEYLQPIACYAYNKRKKLSETIVKGEGLVGAAWQERDTIYLTDIPDDYIQIRSGLGGANPTTILIQPLVNNDDIVGALELASFEEFQQYQIEFIQKLSETIASTISTVHTNSKTKELLEESKQMAEEMKAQEEELRQNMEELEATQEEMRRAQDQIKEKEANLSALIDNTDDTIFALDRKYNITVVNKTLRDKYLGQGIDLKIGKNIFDVLPKEMHQVWKERYDRALSGEKFTKLEERGGTGEKRYVETHHNPIKDLMGNVIGCSVIAKDVTEMVTMQKEIKKKESILNTLINNTDDTFFALDRNYRITVINKTLRERFEKTGITMNEGDYIFDILPKDSHQFWKEKYDRSLAGETFEYFQERPVNDKILYLKAFSRPIFDEDGQVIGASVQSRDITEWKETASENELLKKQLVGLKQKLGLELNEEEKKIATV